MNLQPIHPATPEFVIQCLNCNQRVSNQNAKADLDGEAFKAYYCNDCAYKLDYVERSKPIQSVDDVRRIAERFGSHFFEPSTMRFFRSRIASYDVWADRYFITSEQFVGSDGVKAPRSYTIRELKPDGDVNTAKPFKFQEFATLREAKNAIQKLINIAA